MSHILEPALSDEIIKKHGHLTVEEFLLVELEKEVCFFGLFCHRKCDKIRTMADEKVKEFLQKTEEVKKKLRADMEEKYKNM